MPKKTAREPRNRGPEKKNINVVGRIRGYGKVLFHAVNKPGFCAVSGKLTHFRLRAGEKEISCHSSYVEEGVAILRQRFGAVVAAG